MNPPAPEPQTAAARLDAARNSSTERESRTASPAARGAASGGGSVADSFFFFHRPGDLAEAVRLLAEQPDAVPIAGGTDLMVAVNYRLSRPTSMLDLTGLAELREWTDEGDAIRIGSGVPYSRIVAELATVLPGLAAASRTVGSPQIRNRGTLGGNLATASPAGDGHPPLLATGATIEIASALPSGIVATGPSSASIDRAGDPLTVPIDGPADRSPVPATGLGGSSAPPTADPLVPTGNPGGPATAPTSRPGGASAAQAARSSADGSSGVAAAPPAAAGGSAGARSVRIRTVPIAEYFLGPKRSALLPGELITAVIVPKAAGPQQFLKVGTRNAMVIAVCSLAVALDLDSRRLGTGIGSAGPTPLTAPDADRIELPWSRPALFNDALAEEFGRRVAAAARPIDDVRGTADYRRHALAVCAARALRRVWTAAAHRERTT
jgi:CO/xanthine dehydrogenase FAD-binding subunit